jgi:hypothetical protein
MVTYNITRGESVTLPFLLTEGDISLVDSVTCIMKRMGANGGIMAGTEPIELEVTDRPAANGVPQGWNCYLDDEVSSDLRIGKYLIDIKVVLGAGSLITESCVLNVREGASST